MFTVGQHSPKVDPKVSQMTCSFNHSSNKCDCWHWLACCSVVKCAPQCLCLVWIDERSGVITLLGYTIQMLLHCFGCLLGVLRCCVYEPVICQYENLTGSSLIQICQAFGVQTLKRIGRTVILVVRPKWADEGQSSSFRAA